MMCADDARVPRAPARLPALAVVTAAALASPAAHAQSAWIDYGLSSQLSWTSNADFGVSSGNEDTIVEVRPRFAIRREGGRLRITGSGSLNAVSYANHTRDSLIRPEGDVAARLVAIERLFFVEAGYRASRGSADVFGARPDTPSAANAVTATQGRLSPIIEGQTPGHVRYGLRSDNTWTHQLDGGPVAATSRGYFGRHTAHVEHPAEPFGWKLFAARDRTRYAEGTDPSVTVDLARLSLQYAFDVDFVGGLRAGWEHNDLVQNEGRRSFGGAELRWQPSPRTTLSAEAENRFFGTGWSLAFNHRTPRFAWNLASSRQVVTSTQTLFELPPTDNVTSLLDAMFTTRYPDPVERARAVQQFMASQGLPGATLAPVSLFSQRVSLMTRHGGTLAFVGTRSSVALSAYRLLTQDAPGSAEITKGTAANNNVQRGAGLTFSHRLTPRVSVNASLDWSRVRSLESVGQDETTQRDLRLQLNVLAGEKTSAFVGGRLRKIESTVVLEGREGLAFLGMDHRF